MILGFDVSPVVRREELRSKKNNLWKVRSGFSLMVSLHFVCRFCTLTSRRTIVQQRSPVLNVRFSPDSIEFVAQSQSIDTFALILLPLSFSFELRV